MKLNNEKILKKNRIFFIYIFIKVILINYNFTIKEYLKIYILFLIYFNFNE